jgi:CheY-like chemotaxis protein
MPEEAPPDAVRCCPVLVVDDDQNHREALAEILIDRGHSVRLAADGAAAWAIVTQMEPRPCLIVLDLQMPRMDGYEFLSNLRALRGALGRLPVCVVSGEQISERLPTPYVLRKPVMTERLLAIVEKHCREDHARAAAAPPAADDHARLQRLLQEVRAASSHLASLRARSLRLHQESRRLMLEVHHLQAARERTQQRSQRHTRARDTSSAIPLLSPYSARTA